MESAVALAGRKGFTLGSLYEVETDFKKVVSDLKLDAMSSDDEAKIRGKLAEIIGHGLDAMELSKKLNPGGKLQTKLIVNTLKTVAGSLREAETILRGLETGFRRSHEIDVAIRIREALRKNPKLKKNADQFLGDFCDRSKTISQACLAAAELVKSTKRKGGRKPIDWYDNFMRLLVFIAKRNNIRPTIVVDRVTRKARGRFLELAAGFERLLYPAMRSPSRAALASRLSRSLRRIK